MNGSITIGLMGDVMIGRGVNEMIHRKGHYYVWGDTLATLRNTDLNIANLETTLTRSEKKVRKVFNFKADPDAVNCLADANIQVVNIANNHILDFSLVGLQETLLALDGAGIKHSGAGMNMHEAAAPVLIKKNGISLSVLGCTDNERSWKAKEQMYGTNYINISDKGDRETMLTEIVRQASQDNFVIVSIHWGPNLRIFPENSFVEFAHEMVDHGASLVHGHSAHNFQAIEVYQNKLIFYDTGDFVDDYMVHDDLRNDHSFFYIVQVQPGKIIHARLVPVVISNCQLNHATPGSYEWCMKRMGALSAVFGTTISMDGEIHVSHEQAMMNNSPR